MNEWADLVAREVTLDAFENGMIELVIDRNYLLNIFPIGNLTGFVVTLDEFVRDLGEEFKNYE